MSTKSLVKRPHAARKAAKSRQTRRPATRAETASEFPSSAHTAVHVTAHGLRLSPKTQGRGATAKPRRLDVGTVEVRLDPKAGSAAWRELVTMTIAAAADCVASIPDKERSQVLASVKRRTALSGARPPSSDILIRALQKAGVFTHPVSETVRGSERADRPTDFEIPAANRAALARAFARAEANNVEILKRPEMLRGEEIGERLNLTRGAIDQRRGAGRLLALEPGTKRGVRYPEWQCELVDDAVGRAAFESVLATLAKIGSWSRYRFFVQAAPALGGRTPIEALKAGEADAVRRAAENWVAGEQCGH